MGFIRANQKSHFNLYMNKIMTIGISKFVQIQFTVWSAESCLKSMKPKHTCKYH